MARRRKYCFPAAVAAAFDAADLEPRTISAYKNHWGPMGNLVRP